MLPVLPTTVVGSYSVPEWLERLKTDYYRNRISRSHLGEIHDMAVKAALKDQEAAGIDIVSDGELRRDNDIDYLLARITGVHIPVTVKSFYYDYYDCPVVSKSDMAECRPSRTGGSSAGASGSECRDHGRGALPTGCAGQGCRPASEASGFAVKNPQSGGSLTRLQPRCSRQRRFDPFLLVVALTAPRAGAADAVTNPAVGGWE